MIKVIDSVIVGLLTNTNQFVQVSPPEPNIDEDGIPEQNIDDGDIPEHTGLNYNKVDSETIFDDSIDVERENAIKKIKLETNFYTAFRNTFRIVLNKLENYKIKHELIDIIDEYNLFINKINAVEAIIRDLLEPYIIFNILDKPTIDMLDKIGLCVDRAPGEDKTPYCFTDDRGDRSRLILPKKHLIQKYDNEKVYYGRLADELVRYNKIQNYIINDNTYLNLEQVPYNLHANEIVLLESLMYKEYFNKLTIAGTRTETNNTYDSVMYHDDIGKVVLRSICNITPENMSSSDNIIKNNRKLKGKIKKLKYDDNSGTGGINCMFQLFIDILKDATKKSITRQEIKEILSKELNILVKTELVKLKQTFISQGKSQFVGELERPEYIVDLVMSEHYYLSNIDIYILCKHFKINLIITAQTTLLEARNFPKKDQWAFSLNFNSDGGLFDRAFTPYYILKQEGIKDDKKVEGKITYSPQIYKLLQLDGRLQFHINNFDYDFTKLIEANRVTTPFTYKPHAKKSPNKIPLE